MIPISIVVIFFVQTFHLLQTVSSKYIFNKIDVRSPLYSGLPDCRDEASFIRLKKHTTTRGVVCSAFKNEGGFLSEFLAYYQMHGIDHVRLYDRGSKDGGTAEIEPWLKSGFVSIADSILIPGEGSSHNKPKHDKAMFDKQCKSWAQEKGYDYYFNMDIDEYIVPIESGITVMDAFDSHILDFSQSVVDIPKLNFQSSPHTLEPVDLLTIEAYQLRMPEYNQLTFFKNVSSKVGLRLNHPSYQTAHRDYIVHCCNAFGCELKKRRCRDVSAVAAVIHGVQQPEDIFREPVFPLVIFHYSRSLEKFELQYSVNRDTSGESPEAVSQDVGLFMDQSIGVEHDARAAIRYGCQLREILKQKTGEDVYLRPGPYWYRNVAFGKDLEDGRKGKRNGRPVKDGKKVWTDNPYVYHGYYKSKIMSNVDK